MIDVSLLEPLSRISVVAVLSVVNIIQYKMLQSERAGHIEALKSNAASAVEFAQNVNRLTSTIERLK